MGIILGLDIGTSATKLVAMDHAHQIIAMDRVSASDQLTALFGSIGKMVYDLDITLEDVDQIVATGLGSSYMKGDIMGRPTKCVTEFEAGGAGGLFLSGLSSAIICSIGTGTACIYAGEGQESRHVGGSAVGGGTLVGLAKRLLGITQVDLLADMARQGDVKQVDWAMNEVNQQELSTLPDFATSSNLGKMKSTATDGDVLRGIFNMIYQTAGTIAVFACRNEGLQDVVAIGSLASLDLAEEMLGYVAKLYGLNFIIPEHAAFATAIGAALLAEVE